MDLYRKLITTDGHKDICDFRPNKDSPLTWKDKLCKDEYQVSFEEGEIEQQDKKKFKKTKSLDVNNNVLFELPETASADRLDKKIQTNYKIIFMLTKTCHIHHNIICT